jgi:hypothetical protein
MTILTTVFMELLMNDREARELIARVINSSTYRWRSPRGIAKDAGLPIQKVIELLDRSDAFIRARKGNARGEALYTTREKYRSEQTLTQRLLGAITNKISD